MSHSASARAASAPLVEHHSQIECNNIRTALPASRQCLCRAIAAVLYAGRAKLDCARWRLLTAPCLRNFQCECSGTILTTAHPLRLFPGNCQSGGFFLLHAIPNSDSCFLNSCVLIASKFAVSSAKGTDPNLCVILTRRRAPHQLQSCDPRIVKRDWPIKSGQSAVLYNTALCLLNNYGTRSVRY